MNTDYRDWNFDDFDLLKEGATAKVFRWQGLFTKQGAQERYPWHGWRMVGRGRQRHRAGAAWSSIDIAVVAHDGAVREVRDHEGNLITERPSLAAVKQ